MKTFHFADDEDPTSQGKSVSWTVLDGRVREDQTWLETDAKLDGHIRGFLWTAPSQNYRQHLEHAVLLSVVRLDHTTDDDDLIGLTMMVEAERAIIVCYGVRELVEDTLEKLSLRTAPCSASQLLPAVVVALVKPLESEITRVTDDIDELEDQAMGELIDGLSRKVVQAGRRVLGMRRYLEPMRDELTFLAFNMEELPGSTEARYLRRAADYLGRLIGLLESSLNRVNLLLNQLRNRDEAHLARAMHKLTIVATVFLPLTFITGLLGINVAGIPEAQNPTAFWLVCGFLLGVAVLALIVIRWRHWM